MVSRPAGYRVDTPTDCLEPPVWIGRAMVGKRRMRLWSCEGHSEGLEDLRPIAERPHRNNLYCTTEPTVVQTIPTTISETLTIPYLHPPDAKSLSGSPT
jgi:hypothetical protein